MLLLSRSRCCYWRDGCPGPTPSLLKSPRGQAQTLRALPAPAPAPASSPVALLQTPLPWHLGSSSTQGLRDGMEDDMVLRYDTSLQHLYCGVFDGHGGAQAAQWLSGQLHDIVARRVLAASEGRAVEELPTDAMQRALDSAFTEADGALMDHLGQLGTDVLSNAGSTATILLANQSRIIAANLGDSQGYLLRKNLTIALTDPHRVYGSGKGVRAETDRIKAAGGWVHDGRVCNVLAVSRAFGDWEFKGAGLQQLLKGGVERGYWPQEFADKQSFTSDPIIVLPSVSHTELLPSDEFVVVATDGLWDVMDAADVMRWARNKLKTGRSAQEVAEGLVSVALKRYSSDNISVVLWDFKGPEYWQAQGGGSSNGAKPSWFGGLFGSK